MKQIVVISGKGGTGKTVITEALAKRINKKRALIDGALGTGCPVISS